MSEYEVLDRVSRQVLSQKGYQPRGDRKLMLFDLSVRGHHPSYIQHLIRYWSVWNMQGSLDIVVSPKFLEEHGDVVASADNLDTVRFVAISKAEDDLLKSRKSRWKRALRNFQEWQILCKYAAMLGADHCLIMYFDTFQLPIVLSKTVGWTSPPEFSGIYFRPTFHYSRLANYQPSRQERWQQWREKLILSQLLRHPQLKALFCLDPFAVEGINQLDKSGKAIHLADPVEVNAIASVTAAELRQRLGIEGDRQVFLLFGALNGRKGIFQLLEAMPLLSESLCQRICLLFVGESSVAERIETQVAAVCAARPIQVVRHYEFVAEEEVRAYFELADVVLAPYQRHVGMSGILLLAAAAGKPVLSSDYGLMGEMVRRYQLGLAVDSTQPPEIAKGLTQFLEQSTGELLDTKRVREFAEENSAEQFACRIFESLMSPK